MVRLSKIQIANWYNVISYRGRATMKSLRLLADLSQDLVYHCARHTFATLAIEYGMPIDIIAKILGHTNPNMTLHYARISEANISREMRKIGKMLTV